jgi:hypothetical protein
MLMRILAECDGYMGSNLASIYRGARDILKTIHGFTDVFRFEIPSFFNNLSNDFCFIQR